MRQWQKLCEHEQASAHLNFANKPNFASIFKLNRTIPYPSLEHLTHVRCKQWSIPKQEKNSKNQDRCQDMHSIRRDSPRHQIDQSDGEFA